MRVYECVSFIMQNGPKVLLEKRSEHKETDAGLTTIPGGHIEIGETQTQALFRELDEELNVVPTQYDYLCSLYHPTKELQLIHYFVIRDWKGEILPQEAEEVLWHTLETAQVDIASDRIALNEVARISHHLTDQY